MGGVFGPNVLGHFVENRAGLLSWLKELNPAAFLVMDTPDLFADMVSAAPEALAIYRGYHPTDPAPHRHHSPEDWLKQFGSVVKNGWIQCGNEPSGYVDIDEQVIWFSRIMHLARTNGIRLGVAAYGVGHPGERDIRAGRFDGMIRELADGYHLLLLHEYAKDSPATERPYHIGRFQEWINRARAIGVAAPRIVVSEYGRDNVGPGTGGGRNDGWRGVPMTEGQYVRFLEEGAGLYQGASIPALIFCYGRGGGDDWQSFNIEGAGEVSGALPAMNRKYALRVAAPPAPKPEHDYGAVVQRHVRATRSTHVNIRQQPSTLSPVIGQITVGNLIRYHINPITAGGRRWAKLAAPKNGYFAVDLLKLESVEPESGLVMLTVPYVSQSDADASIRFNDCGIACALMMRRWLEREAGLRIALLVTVDRMINATPLHSEDRPLFRQEVVRFLDGMGMNVRLENNLTIQMVRNELRRGAPVLALVAYEHIVPTDAFKGGHYVVVTGASEQFIYLHDPYRGGPNLRLTHAQFNNALKDVTSVGAASMPYLGIVMTSAP